MSLRALSSRVIRPYIPVAPTAWTAFRGYATKKYTEAHEWISVENDIGTVGITDHAQKSLGDVVFIETPAVGEKFSAEEQIGTVESVKAVSDIYTPVSGEVVEVNTSLQDEPSLINQSAEGEGWLAKIKLSNPQELEALMDEAQYKEHCANDEH
ncbi:Putative Glycine cleavage system H protein [Rhizopus microsporus]|nr:Putative Glycine cleavage system H protein [Rhizopus microsporus]